MEVHSHHSNRPALPIPSVLKFSPKFHEGPRGYINCISGSTCGYTLTTPANRTTHPEIHKSAKMPTIHGVEVWCSTDDGPLSEYTDDQSVATAAGTPRVKSCYITAEHQKQFMINIDPRLFNANLGHRRFQHFSVELVFDGVRKQMPYFCPLNDPILWTCDGYYEDDPTDVSHQIFSGFRFSTVEHRCNGQESHIYPDGLGEIEVRLYRYVESSRYMGVDHNPPTKHENSRVHHKHIDGYDVKSQIE